MRFMSKMSNISVWTTEQVVNWMKGLDDLIQPYVPLFEKSGLTGKQLLVLDHMDLDRIGITKLGHQELILEAVDHLCQLQYSLESETVQSIALKLCCQARCIKSDLLNWQRNSCSNAHESVNSKLPVSVISTSANLVAHIKNFVSWMDRPPFEGSDEYTKKRNDLVKQGLDLIQTVQKESSSPNNHDDIVLLCDTIIARCEHVMHESRDCLTIQPAWLELATLRKKAEEELGMHIQSSYNGTHTIGGIKCDSPADMCKKIGEGDEVIQVNYQTVIGWQLKKLVASLKENPKEVVLYLKRRPCHVDPFGQNHRKQKANRAAGTFPKKRPSGRRSRKGRSPLEELINTTPVETGNFSDGGKEIESESDALDDNVFRSGSESPAFLHNLRAFDDPKQRRATVSGGSPTLKRPSIMISDSDTPRPKSYVLPLHSPGSGESYSFDLTGLDLGSPASDLVSPPAESGESKTEAENNHGAESVASNEVKHTFKSPLTSVSSADSVFTNKTGDKTNFDTTDSSGAALDSSIDVSFDQTDNGEGGANNNGTRHVVADKPIIMTQQSVPAVSVNKPVLSSTKSLPGGSLTDAGEAGTSDRPKSRAIKDYRRTSSKTSGQPVSMRQGSLKGHSSNQATITHPGITNSPSSQDTNLTHPALTQPTISVTNTSLTSQELNQADIYSDTNNMPPTPDVSTSSPSRGSRSSRKSYDNVVLPTTPVPEIKTETVTISVSVTETSPSSQGRPATSALKVNEEQSNSTPSESQADKLTGPNQQQQYGGMGAVPKEISRLSPARAESPRRRKASEQAAKVIAGARTDQNAPTLVKVSRINSMMRAKISEEEKRQREGNNQDAPSGRPSPQQVLPAGHLSPPQEDNRPISMVSSYSVNIIGGVPQIHRSGQQGLKKDGMTQSTQSLLRHKKDRHGTRRRIFGGNRRISCKDLGNGDCQGWLFKRKDGAGVLSSKWVKLWFVLKGSDMYYYKSQEDERARGIIHLPGFQIKPAPEMKSSKLVFKAEHSGTSFFFASERQDDMAKWMNKMGLASIQVTTGENEIQAPFNKPGIIEENPGALHSESEDEEDGESLDAVEPHPNPEDTALEKEFESIRREKLIDPLTNQDRHKNRVSHLQKEPEVRIPNPQEIERMRKLTSLQRTLKDKESELEELDSLLSSDMSAAVLEQFRKEHSSMFSNAQQAESTSDPSLSEGEESGATGLA